jgi:hypothetical protein
VVRVIGGETLYKVAGSLQEMAGKGGRRGVAICRGVLDKGRIVRNEGSGCCSAKEGGGRGTVDCQSRQKGV